MENIKKDIEDLIQEFQNLEIYKRYRLIEVEKTTNPDFLKLKDDAKIAKLEIRKYVSDNKALKEQLAKAKSLEEEYLNHPLNINESVYKEELLELIDPIFDMLK